VNRPRQNSVHEMRAAVASLTDSEQKLQTAREQAEPVITKGRLVLLRFVAERKRATLDPGSPAVEALVKGGFLRTVQSGGLTQYELTDVGRKELSAQERA
jgi:hypothetical protein